MSDKNDRQAVVVVNTVARVGMASWTVGWLFTAGFAHLGAWKGLLCFVLWPWVLGDALGPS